MAKGKLYPLKEEEIERGNEILESMECCREEGNRHGCMLSHGDTHLCPTYCDLLFELMAAGLAAQPTEEPL